jgi:F-type H+-transporting ATPase subunit delta
MDQGKIPVRYAKALISTAEEQGVLDQVRNDMENLLRILKSVPDLMQLLESPIISSSKKLEVLTTIFEGKVQPLTISFFGLAVENKREEHLPGMARMYIDFYKHARGIRLATLKTAYPVDKETRDSLIKMIHEVFNTEIELKEETDKELIGGFILQVENQQLDASVSGQLKKIKKQLHT